MDSDISKLIKENLRISKEIHSMVKALRSHMRWQQFWSIVKIALILIPLILSIIYLPAMLNKIFSQYDQIMQMSGKASNIASTTNNLNADNLKNLLRELK